MKCTLFLFALLVPALVQAQPAAPVSDGFVRADILSVSDTSEDTQRIELQLQNDAGATMSLEHTVINNRDDMRLHEGENIIVQRIAMPDGTVRYLIHEKYRLHSVLFFIFFFFIAGVLIGGRVGFTSLFGLVVSIGILVFFVIPSIIAGADALFICLTGAALIACTSLYLAHGFNRRTSMALISTIITLVLSTLLAIIFVSFAKLFGLGAEESVFLQSGVLENVNLQGLLLGGIIIGALGVLDDITTAQTAAIDELSKANHAYGFSELYKAGTSIGREHIASLINTLALAYIGASLPMFLLFFLNEDMPWWVIANSAFVAEEIVRTLVGSFALLLAVPIATSIAAKAFAHGKHTSARGHSHVH